MALASSAFAAKAAVIMNVRTHLIVGTTLRVHVEKAFGPAVALDGGWYGYLAATATANAAAALLVAYDADGVLCAVELASPEAPLPPALRGARVEPYGTFRMLPGAMALGDPSTRIDPGFSAAPDDPGVASFCERTFCAPLARGVVASVSTSRFGKILRFGVHAAGAPRMRFGGR